MLFAFLCNIEHNLICLLHFRKKIRNGFYKRVKIVMAVVTYIVV